MQRSQCPQLVLSRIGNQTNCVIKCWVSRGNEGAFSQYLAFEVLHHGDLHFSDVNCCDLPRQLANRLQITGRLSATWSLSRGTPHGRYAKILIILRGRSTLLKNRFVENHKFQKFNEADSEDPPDLPELPRDYFQPILVKITETR